MSKADRTREKIIKAAAEAIRVHGPDRVSVARIMAQLKLTHGGFYAHFASKDDLIAAALDDALTDIMNRGLTVTQGKSPGGALSAVIDWYVSAEMRDHPERACPLTTSAGDAPHFPKAARDRLALGVERMAACVEGLLRRADRTSPETEALSVVAEMVGAVSLARAMTDPERSDLLLQASRAALKARLGLPGD